MRLSALPRPGEALQDRICDLHGKLSHAILSLSSSACCCSRRAGGKRWLRRKQQQQGGCGSCVLEHQEEAAAMVDARSLHAARAALEDLEGHLHFLRNVQLRHVAERDAAVARLQRSRILLATRLAEHRWKKHEVIEETLAFVDDVLDKSRFVSPEDVCGTHTHSQSVLKGHDSNLLVRFLSCTLAIAKNCLRLEWIGGALGNTAMFAVSMLAFLQLHHVALGKQTPAVQYRRVDYFHSQLSVKNTKEKHLEVLLARG